MMPLLNSGLRNSVALMITFGLFAIMISLVTRPVVINGSSPTPKLDDIVWKEIVIEDHFPPPVDPPVEIEPPPPTLLVIPPTIPTVNTTTVYQGNSHAPQPGSISVTPTEGALASIVTVAPIYPAKALRNNIEGFCTVEFVVTPAGTTRDISVVEDSCSHSVFWRASIKAAQKFKYAPKRVDGVAITSYGVQKLFTYKIE